MNSFVSKKTIALAHRNGAYRWFFLLLLVASIPLFVWAVLTQRLELRKKAATSEQPIVCWNRVITGEGTLFWPNGCKGDPNAQVCTQVVGELSPLEQYNYLQWDNAGRPYLPGCQQATCDTLFARNPMSFAQCASSGYSGVCFDQNTGEYQGCVPSHTNTCTQNNTNAQRNMLCDAIPPNSSTIVWQTANAFFAAGELTIEVNNMIFTGKEDPGTPVSLHSDPGNQTYTTLERTWTEHGVPMRLVFYFTTDCSPSQPASCHQWTLSEVRILDGKTPGNWFIYQANVEIVGNNRPTAMIGQAFFTPKLLLSSSGGGVHVLTINNLRIQPFFSSTTTPTPAIVNCQNATDGNACVVATACPTCTAGSPCPAMACLAQMGVCLNGICQPPPAGCSYQHVTCVRAPCNPVLVCATPANGTPTPTPHPYYNTYCSGANGTTCCLTSGPNTKDCIRGICQNNICTLDTTPTPTASNGNTPPLGLTVENMPLGISPQGQFVEPRITVSGVGNGNPSSGYLMKVDLYKADGNFVQSAQSIVYDQTLQKWIVRMPIPNIIGTYRLQTQLSCATPSACQNAYHIDQGYLQDNTYFNIEDSSTSSQTSCAQGNGNICSAAGVTGVCQNAHCLIPPQPPTPQTMKLRLKLSGVTDESATGTNVAIKFLIQNGTVMQLSAPLSLAYAGNGVYNAIAQITNPFAPGTKFRINIKGEKHVAVTFCQTSGQTEPCTDTQYITVANTTPDAVYDFTGIPLPPGDLSAQDGKANSEDLAKLTPLMSKLCADLTTDELTRGDVDYNGCVNVRDIFLILQTLETRYDQ